MRFIKTVLWSPVLSLQWVGIKIRTYAAMMSAARVRARGRLVASTTKKIGRYEDHISGS